MEGGILLFYCNPDYHVAHAQVKGPSSHLPQHQSQVENSHKKKNTSQAPFWNLFGIPFFFDDMLLIGMILLLSYEKNEDQSLLYILFLLLFN